MSREWPPTSSSHGRVYSRLQLAWASHRFSSPSRCPSRASRSSLNRPASRHGRYATLDSSNQFNPRRVCNIWCVIFSSSAPSKESERGSSRALHKDRGRILPTEQHRMHSVSQQRNCPAAAETSCSLYTPSQPMQAAPGQPNHQWVRIAQGHAVPVPVCSAL